MPETPTTTEQKSIIGPLVFFASSVLVPAIITYHQGYNRGVRDCLEKREK